MSLCGSKHAHTLCRSSTQKNLATWPDSVRFLTVLQPARQHVTFLLAEGPLLTTYPTPASEHKVGSTAVYM